MKVFVQIFGSIGLNLEGLSKLSWKQVQRASSPAGIVAAFCRDGFLFPFCPCRQFNEFSVPLPIW